MVHCLWVETVIRLSGAREDTAAHGMVLPVYMYTRSSFLMGMAGGLEIGKHPSNQV